MSELARGNLRDRPWGLTLGTLGLRRLTGQATIKSEGKQYCVAFEQGAVVGATSPLPVDAVGRIALTSQLATAAQVAAIQRKTAAFPDRDEVELVAEMNSLTMDQAVKLRRRVVAQRAARTFALEAGDFVVHEDIKIATHHDGALDIRAVVYYGARVNLPEERLIDDLRPFGQQFVLIPQAIPDLEQYGFTEVEAPVLELLREGANLPELEATCRDVDPRTLRAIIYALISCEGAKPQTNVPQRRIVTPVPVAPTPVVPGRMTREVVQTASRPASDVIAPPMGDPMQPPTGAPLDGVSITIGNRTVRPSGASVTPGDLYTQNDVATPRTTTTGKPALPRTMTGRSAMRSTKPPAAANDPTSLNTPSALRAAAPTTSPPRQTRMRMHPPTPPQPTAIGTDPGSRPAIPATGEPSQPSPPSSTSPTSPPSSNPNISFARATTPIPSEVPMFPAEATPAEARVPTPPLPPLGRATTPPPELGRAQTPNDFAGRSVTPTSPPSFGRAQTPLPIDLTGPGDSGIRRLASTTQPPLSRTSTDPALLAAAAADSSPHMARTSTDNAELAEEAFTRGKSALRREEVAEAIAELTTAVQLNANDVDYQAMLAWAKFCNANDKNAIAEETRKWLGRAVLKSPKPDVARFYLGRVERMLGRHREALRHFQEVLAVTPRHAEAQAEVRMLENTLQNEGRGGFFGKKK